MLDKELIGLISSKIGLRMIGLHEAASSKRRANVWREELIFHTNEGIVLPNGKVTESAAWMNYQKKFQEEKLLRQYRD